MILSDAELRREWMVELEEMRKAMLMVRTSLPMRCVNIAIPITLTLLLTIGACFRALG